MNKISSCCLILVAQRNSFSSPLIFIYIPFFKQHFYKQHQAEIGKKIKQMLSNTLRLNLCYLKIIHILHPVIIQN